MPATSGADGTLLVGDSDGENYFTYEDLGNLPFEVGIEPDLSFS